MGKVFNYLGISTGCITNNLRMILKEKKIMLVILHMQQIMN